MARVKETRKFGGKIFKLVTHYFRKDDVREAQSRLKRKGHLTRVSKRKGISGYIYYLWAREK